MNQAYTVNRNLEAALSAYHLSHEEQALHAALLGECWAGRAVFTILRRDGGAVCLQSRSGDALLPLFSSRDRAAAFLHTVGDAGQGEVCVADPEGMLRVAAAGARFGLALDPSPFGGAVLSAEKTAALYQACMLYTGDVPSRETALYYRARLDAQGGWDRIAKADSIGCYHCGAPLERSQIVTFASGADGSRTAVCPLCGRHSVAASCPGDPYAVDAKFLACMHVCFFEPRYNEGKDEAMLRAFEEIITGRAARLRTAADRA